MVPNGTCLALSLFLKGIYLSPSMKWCQVCEIQYIKGSFRLWNWIWDVLLPILYTALWASFNIIYELKMMLLNFWDLKKSNWITKTMLVLLISLNFWSKLKENIKFTYNLQLFVKGLFEFYFLHLYCIRSGRRLVQNIFLEIPFICWHSYFFVSTHRSVTSR